MKFGSDNRRRVEIGKPAPEPIERVALAIYEAVGSMTMGEARAAAKAAGSAHTPEEALIAAIEAIPAIEREDRISRAISGADLCPDCYYKADPPGSMCHCRNDE